EDGIRDFHVTGVQTCALPICVLDPACGSGHFLLYAFDLLAGDPTRSFFGIYEEAWRAEAAPKSEATGRTLKEDYDSELALRRAEIGRASCRARAERRGGVVCG